MATVTFNLKQPYKAGTSIERRRRIKDGRDISSLLNPKKTSVYLHFIYDREHILRVKTIHRILARNWDFERNRPKRQSADYCYKSYFDELEQSVLNEYANLEKRGVGWEELKRHLTQFIKGETSTIKIETHQNHTVTEALDGFIEVNKTILKPGTLKGYKTLKNMIEGFQNKSHNRKPYFFNEINMDWYDKYLDYRRSTGKNRFDDSSGVSDTTIDKDLKNLTKFMKWAQEREMHDSKTYMSFKRLRTTKTDQVTLTKQELIKLHNADMGGNKSLERAKDLGLFLIHTLQRIQDVKEFRIQDIDKENKVWEFKAGKTRKKTRVIFKGYFEKAWEILEKYDFELPLMSEQHFNRLFKEVGRRAGINEWVEKTTPKGKDELCQAGEKWKFMSSHMGRRTGVSLLANDGFPLTLLMEITKHEDIKTLMLYVDDRTKEDQLKQAISSHTLDLFPSMKIAK